MSKINYWLSVNTCIFLLATGSHAQAQNAPDKWTGNQKQAHVMCGTHSLQDAVDRAAEGAEIVVDGICTGEVVIAKDRIRISGSPGATLQAPAGGIALTVLADGVVIRDLAIVGGSISIDVAKGASADITGNDISGYSEAGIRIRANSNAEIAGNDIEGPAGSLAAIVLLSGASAQLIDNQIVSNGIHGIHVAATSSALLSCNNVSVSETSGPAILVFRTAQLGFAPECANTVSHAGMGVALFCSQTSSIFAGTNQNLDGFVVLHPNCEVVRLAGVTSP